MRYEDPRRDDTWIFLLIMWGLVVAALVVLYVSYEFHESSGHTLHRSATQRAGDSLA